MIKREQNKPRAQNDSKSKADRETATLAAQVVETDALFGDSYLPRLKRKERKAAIAATKASGDWLPVSKIVEAVAKAKGARFNDKKRNKIRIAVCGDIVSDSADGRLGNEQFPSLMLLSIDYDETPLPPLKLAETLRIAFDGLSPKKRGQKIAGFLTDHGWMRSAVADQWLGSSDKDQIETSSDFYELPTQEPAGARQAARAYRALKKKYGMTTVPKRSIQWLADNLPDGPHGRDSVARALGKKK